MKAAFYTGAGGVEVISFREQPTPAPQADYVLVGVRAAGLNRADLLQRDGFYPAPPGAPADIPGLEFAGQVEAVGPDVQLAKPGDRVMGLTAGGGGHATHVLAHERTVVPIPERFDFRQAAAIPEIFITAHDALFTRGRLAPGERVLVHAIGSGVGTAALQLARAAGATVFGTARTADKLERARELGLDVAIDTGREDFAEAVLREAPDGVHLVIDFIGAPALAGNLRALVRKGRLVQVATMAGTKGDINLGLLMAKRLTIVGTVLRARPLEEKIEATRLFAEQVLPLLARGAIAPILDRSYPLDQLAEAHRAMEANLNFGKIVIEMPA
jgi:putative PIG3 family NAD(P)H quinone oxidoreductase